MQEDSSNFTVIITIISLSIYHFSNTSNLRSQRYRFSRKFEMGENFVPTDKWTSIEEIVEVKDFTSPNSSDPGVLITSITAQFMIRKTLYQ